MASRLLFSVLVGLAARFAASLLQSIAGNRFDIWSTPTQDAQDHALVEHVVQEQGVALLARDHFSPVRFEVIHC